MPDLPPCQGLAISVFWHLLLGDASLPCDSREMDAKVETVGELLQRGLGQLRSVLRDDDWLVELEAPPKLPASGDVLFAPAPDIIIGISARTILPSGRGQILVEPTLNAVPSTLQRGLYPKLALMRQISPATSAIVMAPWISRRTQEMLDDWGCGYLDLTGNISLFLRHPTIVIKTQGAVRDPRPAAGESRGLRGAMAARLVRLLVDVRPPYRATELAHAANISAPYVSRLLDVIEEEGLLIREGKVVVKVDWERLLRTAAEQRGPFKDTRGYLIPNGPQWFLQELHDRNAHGQDEILHDWPPEMALTGAAAANVVAPLAIGGQIMLHVRGKSLSAFQLENEYNLLPVDEGADLLVIQATNNGVFARARMVEGLPHVALSQLVLDCLPGPGRMPASGEAVLEYMRAHQSDWRLENLQQAHSRLA